MRKISLILVMFMLTAPALADVIITVDQNDTDADSFNVTYEVDDGERVRAIALDIIAHNDVNIVDVNDFHAGESSQWTAKGYGIFPSNFASEIDPEDPDEDWDNSGYTPLGNEADYPDDTLEGLDTNGITVEMGSLYVDEVNKPDTSGLLMEIVLDPNHHEECNKISLALNLIRGGIVLEDGNSPPPEDIILVDWIRDVEECLIGGNAHAGEYNDWANPLWNKPDCWCYCRQCRGDINGKKLGLFWVQSADLAIFRSAFFKNDAALAAIPDGICADLNHKKLGLFRVQAADLTIFRTYFFKTVVPKCDATPVITGPFNFWCDPTNGCPGVCP